MQKDKCANCHQFVDVVLQELNLNKAIQKLPQSFQKFLSKLRETGKADMTLECSPPFQSKFGLTQPSKTFATHEELDLFVQYCLKKDSNFVFHFWLVLRTHF